jgi:hypothetical protein
LVSASWRSRHPTIPNAVRRCRREIPHAGFPAFRTEDQAPRAGPGWDWAPIKRLRLELPIVRESLYKPDDSRTWIWLRLVERPSGARARKFIAVNEEASPSGNNQLPISRLCRVVHRRNDRAHAGRVKEPGPKGTSTWLQPRTEHWMSFGPMCLRPVFSVAEFDPMLARSIDEIYRASNVKV